jgi:hypothetical protein
MIRIRKVHTNNGAISSAFAVEGASLPSPEDAGDGSGERVVAGDVEFEGYDEGIGSDEDEPSGEMVGSDDAGSSYRTDASDVGESSAVGELGSVVRGTPFKESRTLNFIPFCTA